MSFILIIVLLSGERKKGKTSEVCFLVLLPTPQGLWNFSWCFCCCPVDSSWPLVSSNCSSPNGLTTSSSSSSSYCLDDMNMCANEKKKSSIYWPALSGVNWIFASQQSITIERWQRQRLPTQHNCQCVTYWHTHKHLMRLLLHLKWVRNMMSEWVSERMSIEVSFNSLFSFCYLLTI